VGEGGGIVAAEGDGFVTPIHVVECDDGVVRVDVERLADGKPAVVVIVGIAGLSHLGEAAGVDVGEELASVHVACSGLRVAMGVTVAQQPPASTTIL